MSGRMSEMRRLSEEGASDLELDLLRSAKHDAPLPGARRRTMVALGVGGGLLATTTASATSMAGIGLMKWLGIVAVASAAVAGSVAGVQAVSAPAAGPAAVGGAARATLAVEAVVVERARAEVAVAEQAAVDAAADATPPQTIAMDSLPTAPTDSAPVEAAGAGKGAAAAGTAAPSLADEVAALDRASQAMASDPKAALKQLEAHDKRFAGGALGPEAMVLRIEALARSGDAAGATALANQFFAKHPDSPLRGRVQSVVARARAEQPSQAAPAAGAPAPTP